MKSHDKFGNEVQVGDLLVSADSSRNRQYVCFVTELDDDGFASVVTMHVSPRRLMNIDGHATIRPEEFILLTPVTAKVAA